MKCQYSKYLTLETTTGFAGQHVLFLNEILLLLALDILLNWVLSSSPFSDKIKQEFKLIV